MTVNEVMIRFVIDEKDIGSPQNGTTTRDQKESIRLAQQLQPNRRRSLPSLNSLKRPGNAVVAIAEEAQNDQQSSSCFANMSLRGA